MENINYVKINLVLEGCHSRADIISALALARWSGMSAELMFMISASNFLVSGAHR